MNKKIVSAILAVCLCFNISFVVSAEGLFPYDGLIFGTDGDEVTIPEGITSDYQKEVETIIGFRWMDTIGENDFNSKGLISEYDMYEALMNALRGTESEKNIYVSNDNVTFEMLADTFINNLSLSIYTDEESNFFSTAENIGLFKGMTGISKDMYVTREQLAKVLYNALFLPRYKLVANGVGAEYTVGNTLLEDLGIEIIKGVVTANQYMNFFENTPLSEGYVCVNKFKVDVGNTDACNMLGEYVTAYVKDVEETPILIYLRPEERKNRENFKFTTDDFISHDTNNIVFYDLEEKERKVKVNPQARVIYNGKYYGQYSDTDVFSHTDKEGFIQTIEIDDDSSADIVLVTVYDTYVVESIYKTDDDFIINDMTSNRTLRNSNEVSFCFVKDGRICTYDDIEVNNVLYVAQSEDRELYLVYISDKSFTSVIKSTSEEEIETEDGRQIKISKNFNIDLKLKPAVIYLGYDGKLAWLKYLNSDGLQYGYVMSMYCDTEENDNGKIVMKVYTMDDETVKYESEEKIKFIDGASAGGNDVKVPEKKMYAKDVYDAIAAKGVNRLVQFSLNSEGKIVSLATALDTTSTGKINEDVFSKDYSGPVRLYNIHMGSRFKRTGIKSYMIVPKAKEKQNDEKYYSVKVLSYDSSLSDAEFYDATVNGNVQDGVVVSYSDSQNAEITYKCSQGVIIKNTLIYSVDDEEVKYQITLINGDGAEKNILIDPDNIYGLNAKLTSEYADVSANELKAGDIILYETDDLGELTAFSLEVRCGDDEMKFFEATQEGDPLDEKQNFSSRFTTLTEVVGVEQADDDVIFSTNNRPDKNLVWNRCFCVRKAKPVLIYDRKSKKITSGNGNDILKGDKIYIYQHYEYITQTYIIIR